MEKEDAGSCMLLHNSHHSLMRRVPIQIAGFVGYSDILVLLDYKFIPFLTISPSRMGLILHICGPKYNSWSRKFSSIFKPTNRGSGAQNREKHDKTQRHITQSNCKTFSETAPSGCQRSCFTLCVPVRGSL